MTVPFVDAEGVRRLLPVEEAIEVLEQGFADGRPEGDPPRTVVDLAGGQLLLMPSARPAGVGVKLVTIAPDNPARGAPRIQGLYLLFDAATLGPRAVIDGAALTSLRTPAVSAVATRRLAVPDASRLVVLGAGPQAEGHVHALRAVRPIESVVVVAPRGDAAESLAGRLRGAGIRAERGGPAALADADVVCACTTSRVPVVHGRALAPHAHVNAIGSHEPDAREVDTAFVRAAQVAVETRAAALAEAGDLLVPLRGGELEEAAILWDLGELVRGEGPVPVPERWSLFKSVGIGFEDLLVAEAVAERLPGARL